MDGARLDATMMGTLGSSTSLPLSTLSSPYYPEHTLPMLETLRESEDSPRVEEKGKSLKSNLLALLLNITFFRFCFILRMTPHTKALYLTFSFTISDNLPFRFTYLVIFG